jgi:hypothetical protein
MIRKKLAIGLVIAMLFAIITPMPMTTVFAATTDTLTCTFDPEGNISIEISPASYDFGTIWANEWKNTSSSAFTLYNNGTSSMDTGINVSTSPTNFTIDNTGACNSDDQFGVYTYGLDSDGWLDTADAGGTSFDTAIVAGGSKTFGLNMTIGNITSNFGQDSFVVTVEGSVS